MNVLPEGSFYSPPLIEPRRASGLGLDRRRRCPFRPIPQGGVLLFSEVSSVLGRPDWSSRGTGEAASFRAFLPRYNWRNGSVSAFFPPLDQALRASPGSGYEEGGRSLPGDPPPSFLRRRTRSPGPFRPSSLMGSRGVRQMMVEAAPGPFSPFRRSAEMRMAPGLEESSPSFFPCAKEPMALHSGALPLFFLQRSHWATPLDSRVSPPFLSPPPFLWPEVC